MKRRDFLKVLSASIIPASLPGLTFANVASDGKRRIVLLIELKGANDGVNTLIPYTSPAYYAARPTIAIERSSVLQLSGQLGLHPAMAPLMAAWKGGEMAWVQGVGYDNPNLSHFESIEIWESGNQDVRELHEGWVAQCFPKSPLGGVAIDTNLGPLYGEKCSVLSITDPVHFANSGKKTTALQSALDNPALQHILDIQANVHILSSSLAEYLKDIPKEKVAFAPTLFGRNLASVYKLIASGIGVPAYKLTLGNFDTHVRQLDTHADLLSQLALGLATLRTNLMQLGMWDEVLVMTYSEFGRRLQENGSNGTDHGAAAPHLVMGGKVKGGFYGAYPSLTSLDERKNLIYTTDFRDMYATVKKNWWGLGSAVKSGLAFV